jgi:hypothetical protein
MHVVQGDFLWASVSPAVYNDSCWGKNDAGDFAGQRLEAMGMVGMSQNLAVNWPGSPGNKLGQNP